MPNCPDCGQVMTQLYLDENVDHSTVLRSEFPPGWGGSTICSPCEGVVTERISHPRCQLSPWYACSNSNCNVLKAYFDGGWRSIERRYAGQRGLPK